MINIIKTKSGQYRVQTIAINKKLLQQSETLPTWKTVYEHIIAVSKAYDSTNWFYIYYHGTFVGRMLFMHNYQSFSSAIKKII